MGRSFDRNKNKNIGYNNRYSEYDIWSAILITAALLILGFFIFFLIKEYYNTRVETEPMIVTVQDKERHTYTTINKVGKTMISQVHYNYYLIFDDNIKISVGSSIYNKYNKGDEIVIMKNCRYKNDTGKLIKVTYSIDT